jgi:hypothetical protein
MCRESRGRGGYHGPLTMDSGAFARVHFRAVDALARATGADSVGLLYADVVDKPAIGQPAST